jgi:Subtilase family/F5/8 type C domain
MFKPILKAGIVALGILIANDGYATKLQFPSPKATLAPTNENGDHLYLILLRADYVRELGDAGVPPPIAPSDMTPTDDPRAWHRANARKMVGLLEQEYAFSANSMTSWIAPTFTAYLSEAQFQALDEDPRVDTIAYEEASEIHFSASPPWSDVLVSSEWVSYGKVATDTNDNVTPTNTVYLIDAGMTATTKAHVDLDGGFMTYPSTGNVICANGGVPELHTAAVASVLSAEHGNSAGVKGVNNAGPIIVVPIGNPLTSGSTCDEVSIRNAMDWAVGDMETKGITGVISMSLNQTFFADHALLMVPQFLRKASARALVVESAGNDYQAACTWAYGPRIDGDGILVVSAVNSAGKEITSTEKFDESQVNGGSHAFDEQGSNYGACVEAWAPGQLIWVDFPDGTAGSTTKRLQWSGTSFSAPTVAAIAARYGTSSTNPVLREAFIRSKLFSTGFNDTSGQAIKVPSYTQSGLFTIPTKLTPSSLTVSSTYLSNVASNATDGNYLTTMWNSGVQPVWPSTQPYIQFDLGATKTLYSMRFMPAQSPSGTSVHDVYVGTSNPPTTLYSTITRSIMDGEMLSMNLGGTSARYVRLVTRQSPSWAAYYEVEIFGN